MCHWRCMITLKQQVSALIGEDGDHSIDIEMDYGSKQVWVILSTMNDEL